jgi:hypothetical protein
MNIHLVKPEAEPSLKVGDQINNMTVIEYLGREFNHGQRMHFYNVQCVCGHITKRHQASILAIKRHKRTRCRYCPPEQKTVDISDKDLKGVPDFATMQLRDFT